MDILKTEMNTLGFDIIYKNRHSFSRYKSGGLLIAIKKDTKFQWQALPFKSDVFISVQVDKKCLGLQKHLIVTSVYVPPSKD